MRRQKDKKTDYCGYLYCKSLFLAFIWLFAFFMPLEAWGATLEVGTGKTYSSIQAAISVANPSTPDEVLVYSGIYQENIDFEGKGITVRSDSGAVNTIIKAAFTGSVVTFNSGEVSSSVLDGFTITNGSAVNGAGIACYGASPIIKDCIITSNTASSSGGGLYTDFSLLLINSIVEGNSAVLGGGIFGYSSSVNIVNSTIEGNTATFGDGVYLAFDGFGIHPVILNSIVWNDNVFLDFFNGALTLADDDVDVTIVYSDIELIVTDVAGVDVPDGSWGSLTVDVTGRINQDPSFIDSANDDYKLNTVSPCINAAVNVGETYDSGNLPVNDIEDIVRTQGGRYDMGAHEYCSIPQTFYLDSDGDGYGDINNVASQCAQPDGYVSNSLDCNDLNATAYPGAAEVCDGVDNNCVGGVDEGLTTYTYYSDVGGSLVSCEVSAPSGYVSNADFNVYTPSPPSLSAVTTADINNADPAAAETGFTNNSTVDVALSASGELGEMILCEDVGFLGCSWVTYAASTTYTFLDGTNELKTIYAKVRNTGGESTSQNSMITLDTQPPALPANTLLTPNGGESWERNTVQNITWTASNITDTNIKTSPLEVSYDILSGTEGYPGLIGSDLSNTSPYPWMISGIGGSTIRIKITAYDKAGNTSSDTSSSDFSIYSSVSLNTLTNYTITGIGHLGTGDSSEAYGMDSNLLTKVVGVSRTTTADTSKTAFVWSESDSSMYALATLAPYTYSAAYDINDAGLIVGESWNEDSRQACIWDASAYPVIASPTALPKLLAFHNNTMAYSINNNNKVVGLSGSTAVMRRACIWDVSDLNNITVTDLGALPGTGTETGSGYSAAFDISENDMVSGYSFLYDTAEPYSANRGCFWNASNLNNITITELGYISASAYRNSYGSTIHYKSNTGTIKIAGGSTDSNNNTEATIWEDTANNPGTTTTIGHITGETIFMVQSYGIVDTDDPVGTAVVGKDANVALSTPVYRAFAWGSTEGIMRVLYDEITTGKSSWNTLYEARDINENWKIIGFGQNIAGENEAFLLTQ